MSTHTKITDVDFRSQSIGRYENGMHELRHFFASVLLDQGESIKAVAEWLGHADPSFTLKIYTHLMPSSADRTKT